MRSALLALTPNSNPSAEDHKAKELAQQINFKAESSLLRQASESRGAESEPSTCTQGDISTSAGQEAAESPQAEQAEASPATQVVEELRPPAAPATGRPLSPRQRRAQQHSQQGQRNSRDPASRPAFTPAPRQPQVESNAGSAVLIVLLTLALAALIFRRIYLAQEYELWPSRLPPPFLTLELSPPATTQTELWPAEVEPEPRRLALTSALPACLQRVQSPLRGNIPTEEALHSP